MMKKIFSLIILVLVIIFCVSTIKKQKKDILAFERHESLIAETNECLESREWACAEKNVKILLKEFPNDSNLQLHLAGILFEQERYEECITYVNSLNYSNSDLEFIKKKSAKLIQEKKELGIENSMHFRLEFEGRLSKKDIMEALAVLEVAYDSLCHLFDFRPENKMAIVLYESQEFQGVGPRPNWVGAVFDGKLRVPVNVMQYREFYRPILVHELTHSFVRAMTRAKIPLWMDEGIAQIVDGSRTNNKRPYGPKPSLEMLTESFVNQSNTDVAKLLYWYSQKMVETLISSNGITTSESFIKFKECIQDIKKTSVDESLKKHYNVSPEEILTRIK